MDATRTPLDYLCRCVEAAIKAGATTINLPDTVGYATPSEYRDMFANVRARVPNADKAVFSVHCHNDLGLAIANSLAGIEGGARQVECTINGIGERAGNAALEEIVMALRTRADVLPYETGIESPMLTRASKLVSHATNFPVQFNKAIGGRNAFAHESGIHQDGMLKNAETFEIMRPEDVGLAGPGDVGGDGAGEARDGRALGPAGDLGDRLEIAVRRDGEPGLDDGDAHRGEQLGHRELLVEGHGGAGALLAVAQRGGEDQDPVAGGGGAGRSHGITLSRAARHGMARRGVVPSRADSRMKELP